MVRSAFSKRHPRPPARKPARGEPISIHPITLVFSHEAHEQFFRIQQFRKVAKFGQFLRFMCGYQLAVSLAAPIFGAGFFYATREEDSTSIWTAVELFFSNRTVLTVAINAIHFAGVAVGINYMFVQNLSQTRVHEARVHSLCSWFHFFNVVCFSLVTWLFSFDLDPHVGLPILIRSFTGTVATICYTHLFACSFSVRVNLLAFLTFLMVIYPPAQLSDVVSLAQQRCLCLVAICAGELVGYLVEHTSRTRYIASLQTLDLERHSLCPPASHGSHDEIEAYYDDGEEEDQGEEEEEEEEEEEDHQSLASGCKPPSGCELDESAHRKTGVPSEAQTGPNVGPACGGGAIGASEGGTAGGRPFRGTACSTELTTIATRAVRCALVVKQAVQGELAVANVGPLCALCQGSRATHYMLPCMCKAVCEPCGKLKLFRYDDPTMPSSVIVPRCPTCSAPAESMIAIDTETLQLHVCMKLPLGASIKIE